MNLGLIFTNLPQQIVSAGLGRQRFIKFSHGEERLRKRPRMPAGLSADQKAKNREIVKRMQMKAWVLDCADWEM